MIPPVAYDIGTAVPSVVMFQSVLYNGVNVGCYAGGLSKLYLTCMINGKGKFVGMFMNYLHTKFHMPHTDGSIVTILKSKGRYRFCATAMLFYILQEMKTTRIVSFIDLLTQKDKKV
jgi:hypothetical protein